MSKATNAIELLVDEVSAMRGPRGGDLGIGTEKHKRRNAPFSAMGGVGLHTSSDKALMGLQSEQPWHRMAAHLMLAKTPNETIATAAGVGVQQITILKGQTWFQELLMSLANELGTDIADTIRGEALASVQTMVEIRDDTEAPTRVRLEAAKNLLEHGVGKAIQRIVSENTNKIQKSPSEEMAELTQELARIRAARLPQLN